MNSLRYSMALVLCGLAGVALSRVPAELWAFGMQLQGPVQAAQALQEAPARSHPWSERGQSYVLKACLEAQVDRSLTLYPTSYRADLSQSCRDVAQQVVQRSPSYGLGHLALAQAFGNLGQDDAFAAALTRAQALAPFEGWMASWRVLTLMRAGPPPDAAARHLARQDVDVMRRGVRQLPLLAGYYHRFPEWRPEIAAALQDAPQQIQDRFFGMVRRHLKGKG